MKDFYFMKNFWKKVEKPILALAPMAGITDSAFRQICRENGADVVYSEMANVSAFFHNSQKTLELVKFSKNKEKYYVVQFFGKNPEHFAKATLIVTKKIKPHGIDINFGCPAKKVFGHGSGCALMPQKKLAREIIKAVCENTTLPVSIKIRAGIGSIDAVEFIKNIKDLPFSTVMIHGRTYEGKFTGKVDFEIVSKIKKIISNKIVLANGGIDTPEKALEILNKYPDIDGLGIARGILGKPFLFKQIKEIIKSGKYAKYNFAKIAKLAVQHAQLLYKTKGDKGMFEIRKHLVWYFKGFPGTAELRKKLVLVKSVKEIKTILKI